MLTTFFVDDNEKQEQKQKGISENKCGKELLKIRSKSSLYKTMLETTADKEVLQTLLNTMKQTTVEVSVLISRPVIPEAPVSASSSNSWEYWANVAAGAVNIGTTVLKSFGKYSSKYYYIILL